MSLLQLKNACLGFGIPPLFDKVELVVQPGERICLVGRNGCGKSTMLKVIEGMQVLDDGQRIVTKDVVISRLPQDPPESIEQSIFDYVAEGLQEAGELLKQYFLQTQVVASDYSDQALQRLEQLQQQLEHKDAWQLEQKIQQVLTRLGLQPEQQLSQLSGGWRRKVALAKALVGSPDILLLDEPTNHLDISMIKWLEDHILDFQGAIIFVSHDRAFIRRVATRIVDIDRGFLTSYPVGYDRYLEQKEQALEVEAQHNALFDKKLSQEEAWIRQGIKARRTRNEGRVRALKALRNEYADRRKRQGTANVSLVGAENSGKVVFECQQLSFSYEGSSIVNGFDFAVQRGEKIAFIGPNGCGKSTLIKLLLGQLQPESGKVKTGTKLEVAYFDQYREQLDPDKTVIDVVADGKKEIHIDGREKHVMGYLQDYLFSPDRVRAPVSSLSGGEKNRLLLAKLFSKPSNLLILDEPTNDLDVETLELLEEILSQYQGTVILVSHDREFVDNVVTRCVNFEGKGALREFVGGYSDMFAWYQQNIKKPAPETSGKSQSPKPQPSAKRNKKLSYKLQQELSQLPALIEQLEEQVETRQTEVSDPEFFKQDSAVTNERLAELAQLQQQLEDAYGRWDELEAMTDQ